MAGALVMLAWASPRPIAQRAVSQSAALEDFQGTWAFTRAPADLRSLERGIDRVADQFNIFIREIARGEMRRRLLPVNRVVIAVESETRVRLAVDGWGPYTFELGGPLRRVQSAEGHAARSGVSFRSGRLVHREVEGEGHRTNVFSLNADGSRLTLRTTIGSDQLPDDVRYRLTFRRAR